MWAAIIGLQSASAPGLGEVHGHCSCMGSCFEHQLKHCQVPDQHHWVEEMYDLALQPLGFACSLGMSLFHLLQPPAQHSLVRQSSRCRRRDADAVARLACCLAALYAMQTGETLLCQQHISSRWPSVLPLPSSLFF